jgi:phage replication O-like protein O
MAVNYTQFPNWLIDEVLPQCTPHEWKIICAIIRKTNGWNKERDQISYSQFEKLTGIKNKKTLSNAIVGLIEKGLIDRKKHGKQSFTYQVTSYRSVPVSESKPVTVSHQTGYRSVPEPVTVSYPQKKKETNKRNSAASPNFNHHEIQVGEPDPIDQLMTFFAEKASKKRDFAVTIPSGKELQKPWMREKWDEATKDILQFFRNDLAESKLAVNAAIEWNYDNNLSIETPKSIRGTILTIHRNNPDTSEKVTVGAI